VSQSTSELGAHTIKPWGIGECVIGADMGAVQVEELSMSQDGTATASRSRSKPSRSNESYIRMERACWMPLASGEQLDPLRRRL
jgi:hypothetical protein